MLALAQWEATRCPACGGSPDDCQGPAAEFRWKVSGPVRCHRTAAKRRREREWLKGKGDEIPDSLLFRVEG